MRSASARFNQLHAKYMIVHCLFTARVHGPISLKPRFSTERRTSSAEVGDSNHRRKICNEQSPNGRNPLMPTPLEVEPELASKIQARAQERDVSVNVYLRELIDQKATEPERSNSLSSQERVRMLREWASGHSANTPLLSDDAISRESNYGAAWLVSIVMTETNPLRPQFGQRAVNCRRAWPVQLCAPLCVTPPAPGCNP